MSEEKIELQKAENIIQKKGFIDFIIILVKWRKLIFWNAFIFTLASIIISYTLIDKWYTSTVSVIPPKKKGGLFGDIAGFSSTIKDISKTLGRLGSTSDEAFNYLAILNSRNCLERVIYNFNLRQVYKIDIGEPIENVISELKDNVGFNVEDEGNITIKATDKNPIQAAKMANYFVEVLNQISTELSVNESRSNRIFIEKRYIQLLDDLKTAEDSMKSFGEQYNVFEITEQTKAAIKAVAELKSGIEINELELNLLKMNLEKDHPLVQQQEMKIQTLNEKLKLMKFGDDSSINSDADLYVPFKNLPDIGLKYLRFKRDLEIQTKLMEFLLPVYEQAKIEEQKDIPVVLVLDKAVPPQKKAGPRVSIIAAATLLLSTFLSIVVVLLKNSLLEMKKEEEKYKKLEKGIFIPLRKFFSSNS